MDKAQQMRLNTKRIQLMEKTWIQNWDYTN